MNIEKGYCRLVFTSGLVAFGEVQEVKEKHIMFKAYKPSAIGEKVMLERISTYEKYNVDDIPAYE